MTKRLGVLKCVQCLNVATETYDIEDAVCITHGHSLCLEHALAFNKKMDKIFHKARKTQG